MRSAEKFRYVLVILLLMSTLVFVAATTAREPHQSIVGSWVQIDDDTGDMFFATFHGNRRNGTFNFTSPDNSISLSHGAWKKVGAYTFHATDVGFNYDENGLADTKFQFNTRIELGRKGNTASLVFHFVITKLDGTVRETGSGTGSMTRIQVHPVREQGRYRD